MAKRLIVLMTDYGYRDTYVGVVKGVIKSINPEADIVDLTHGVTRHNVFEAALMLAASAKYFPKGTIFVVVVDPGVGSERRAILIETSNYILVGPDNGCLTILAEQDGVKRVIDISNTRYRLPETSSTFHGRDIFAPVAAWISRGVPIEEFGPEIPYESIVKTAISEPEVDVVKRIIVGEVIYVDVYGNLMTNIRKNHVDSLNPSIGSKLKLQISGRTHVCTYESSFSKVPAGEIACYINSWGYFEVAINMGDASKILGVEHGAKIVVSL